MTAMGAGEKWGRITGSEANACSDPVFPLPEFLPAPEPRKAPVVIDTNIILDMFVFNDAAAKPIKKALESGELDWIATQPMRDELARVLAYRQIVPRLAFYKLVADDVLANFDKHARLADVASKASLTCSDADDQKFIDLAVAHKAMLLSKDKHVISMRKRLLAQGIRAQAAI